MPPRVRLRSRRQTTGPQSSTRLLKRPGERPRAAKPQPSEQGVPPRRRRLAQRKQPTSAPSKKTPHRKQTAPRSEDVLTQMRESRRGQRTRLPNARNARRRRRRSVKPPARSSAKRPRRQSEKLPGSRRWRLPHRQNAKLRRRSRPSARRLNEQNARPPNR